MKEYVLTLVEQHPITTGLQSILIQLQAIYYLIAMESDVGDHYSALCTKAVSTNDQRDILKKSGHCYNCLRSHHKSKDCDSQKACRYCR